MEVVCKCCGTVNDSNSKFCKKCYRPFNDNSINNSNQIDTEKQFNNINQNNQSINKKIYLNEKGNMNIIIDLLFTFFLYSIILYFITPFFRIFLESFTELKNLDSNLIYNITESIISTLLAYLLATKSVFKKKVPYSFNIKSLLITIFIITFGFEFGIRAYYINLDTLNVESFVYIFLATAILFILLIIINYICSLIYKKRNEVNIENTLLKFNIFIIIVIIILLILGIYLKNDIKNKEINNKEEINENATNQDDISDVYYLIDSVSKNILIKIINGEEVTSPITDLDFIDDITESKPEKIELYLNDHEITNGIIVYKGVTYTYSNNRVVKQK